MEGRMSKYREVSPERAKVWKERSPNYVQIRKVPVVYYLCRNRQLEHPHFIEVPISSPKGLYLRDVIQRLNAVRGRGMASLYSWSSKRSYKNGFVWHDLCEDDLILPAHGDEYILKGSEIIQESNSGGYSPVSVYRMHNLKQLPEPPTTCRSQDDTSPSMSTDGKETKHPREEEISPPSQRSGSSAVSPESRAGSHSPWSASLSLTEYKVPKTEGAADASTQTEENAQQAKHNDICTRGVSTEDGAIDGEHHENTQTNTSITKQSSEVRGDYVSPPSSSSASSSGGKAETLESLIRSDLSKINNFKRLEEDMRISSSTKLRASSMLMQLISCGSISVKDHSFGLIPIYKPRFSDSKFPSPLYSTSVMLGELDCLSDNSRLMGLRLEDKEYFSGSLVEAKMPKEQGDGRTLKRSSSYNADRSSKKLDSVDNNGQAPSTKTKCIPRSIKSSLNKPRSESLRSPASDRPRVSSDGARESRITSRDASSNGSSKRMSEPSSGKNPSTRVNSFREDNKIIKIEERLTSGARVIIQSKECQS